MVEESRKSQILKKSIPIQYISRMQSNPSDLTVEGGRIDRFLFWEVSGMTGGRLGKKTDLPLLL